jgi:hypothetical protein
MAAHLNLKPAESVVPVRPAAHPERRPTLDQRSAEETAHYISQMTTEMASIARAADMQLLAYFLDMARLEANVIARKTVSQQQR